MGIVFFGSGPVATASLASLLNDFDIEAIITKAVPPHHKESAPVETLAETTDIELLFANSRAELDRIFSSRNFKSELGVIVDYGVIVSQAVIDAFELGIVNSHFSLLPEWRGADPITFSILSGQPKTGVSLMLIEPSLDTGKLLTQKSRPISPNETTESLTEKLIDLSNRLLAEYLPLYLSGTLKPHAQPHPDRATHSRKLTKEDGLIDWHKPAAQIEREIRAYKLWPKSRTTIAGKEVTITEAHVSESQGKVGEITVESNELVAYTSAGKLVIDRLKPDGKREMNAQDFIRGYCSKL